ncbi:MAG: acyltransferase family protein [Thauera sp.]
MSKPAFTARDQLGFIIHLRTLSVLYIVGFWHLLNYTSIFPGYANPVTTRITVVVLGLFCFISGYLCCQQRKHENFSAKDFYTKKLTRIYLPYLLALCLFLAFNLSDKITLRKL